MTMDQVIAIDGPAGAGKSTTARGVAKTLQWQYVDTGAMYRALALAATRANVPLDDQQQLRHIVRNTLIELRSGDPIRVFLNREDVTEAIRTPVISEGASKISVHSLVRSRMVQLQRELGLQRPSVLEGRDIGSVVFPNAGLKVFLEADIHQRASRRLEDYRKQGIEKDLQVIMEEIRLRDNRDRNRSESPLVRTPDAVVVDTSNLTIAEQINQVVMLARERFKLNGDNR